LGKIKLLSEEIINQIAAGEIVERPASALKEIVENSIDAGARSISVFLGNGGKSKMVIEDDGEGMSREDLSLSIRRHATSKMHAANLFDINSYGFRGEALSSIASISAFSIESNGFGISVNAMEVSEVYPSSVVNGTRVTVANIFGFTPARLKFLKSDSVELSACLSTIENFALVKEGVNFEVRAGEQLVLSFKDDTIPHRISKIFGADLSERAVYFEEVDGDISVRGYLFHPLDSKYSSSLQRVFVNGRIVRDRTVSCALKNAYRDLIPSGRFAAAIVYVETDPFHVDINVSPTKSEIRFRDAERVQRSLTSIFRRHIGAFDETPLFSRMSLGNNAIDTSARLGPAASPRMSPPSATSTLTSPFKPLPKMASHSSDGGMAQPCGDKMHQVCGEQKQLDSLESRDFFGTPICQIFGMYIIAEKDDSIVIINQHAVHEKITQEKILKNMAKEDQQYLIRPEIIELTARQREFILSIKCVLEDVGFALEVIQNSLFISAIPAILPFDAASSFMANILETEDTDLSPIDLVRSSIANIACHRSIRAGRRLHLEEMRALLREMEGTPSIHQCNHNRPSFTVIRKDEIDKLFQRGS
jgi:DNA mismatch repair protein MutL